MSVSRRTMAGAVALAGAGATAWWLSSGPQDSQRAPDVGYTLLDGQLQRLSALRGQVVLVNFWATSCTTCVAEMPELVATHQKYAPQGYRTLAVAMSYDPPAYVANFVSRRQLPFHVTLDNTGDIARQFGDVKVTPTTFLLDKQGRVVKRYVGAPDFASLHRLIEQLLAQA